MIRILILFSIPLFAKSAVTYELSPGRFGDQILGYIHAKWVSYRYGIPLLYKPFFCSEELALHDLEEPWTEEKNFKKGVCCSGKPAFDDPDTLYTIPFFSDLEEDRILHPNWNCSLDIDWEDSGFRNLLRASFSPRKSRTIFAHNTDCVSVALHVRRGGKGDIPNPQVLWPMRFAPDSYYIQCLRQLAEFFPRRAIHAHIFTDDLDPQSMIRKFQRILADLPITFSYRTAMGVLDDFFGMMNFDCLIRSASNYSLIPSLVGEYQVVMTPKHGYWTLVEGAPEYYIDEIKITHLK